MENLAFVPEEMVGMRNFEKVKVVGRGAHGCVYLCHRIEDGRPFIIKQIPVDAMTAAERETALDEVRVLEKLNHPNIIKYYAHFIEESSLCIVMDYAQGGTLLDLIQAQKGVLLSEERVMSLFAQILLSLHHLHQRQILHRDMKTQNILMNKNRKSCRLSDFGLAKMLATGKSKATTVLGTPNYVAPEICEGQPYDQKGDIWALGCILYELVALKKAFDGENISAVIMKVMKGNYAPIPNNYSDAIHRLISQMLDINHNKRPSTAEILANPLVIGPIMDLMLNAGSLPCKGGPRKPLTPKSSSKFRAGSLRKAAELQKSVSQGSPHSTNTVYHIYALEFGEESAVNLSLPASHLGIRQVAVGPSEKMAVTEQGRVLVWPESDDLIEEEDAADVSARSRRPHYLKSPSPVTISQVACGDLFTAFITDRGMLMTSGSAATGCLGHGSLQQDQKHPKIVEELISHAVKQVACGSSHVLALTDDNIVYGWGSPDNGRLGVESSQIQLRPVKVPLPSDRVQIHSVHCSLDASALVCADGVVLVTGNNRFNKLGVARPEEGSEPIRSVRKLSVARSLAKLDLLQPTAISLGLNHTAAITDGRVVVVGAPWGPRGLIFLSAHTVQLPVDVAPRRVTCAENSTFIVTSDQKLWIWKWSGGKEELLAIDLKNCPEKREVLTMNAFNQNVMLCARSQL